MRSTARPEKTAEQSYNTIFYTIRALCAAGQQYTPIRILVRHIIIIFNCLIYLIKYNNTSSCLITVFDDPSLNPLRWRWRRRDRIDAKRLGVKNFNCSKGGFRRAGCSPINILLLAVTLHKALVRTYLLYADKDKPPTLLCSTDARSCRYNIIFYNIVFINVYGV